MAVTTIIKKLVHQLEIDNKGFSIGLKDSEGKLVNFQRTSKLTADVVKTIVGAMGAVVGASAELTRETVKVGDKWDKMSQSLGISVEKLSAYDHVANLSGTSVEGLATGVGRLSRNILDASQGVGEGKEAFERLGISVTDSEGKLKNADAVMLEIAGKFEQMPDGAEKTALSMELLGRSGKDLVPMFNLGTEGMAAMLAEGEKFRGWTTAQAKEAALLNDNFTRILTIFKGVKDSIGKELIPLFQAITEVVLEWSESYTDLDENMASFSEIIRNTIIPTIFTLIDAGESVKTGWQEIWNGINIVVKSVAAGVIEGINAILKGATKLPLVGDKFKDMSDDMQAFTDETTEKLKESVDKDWQSLEKNVDNHKRFQEKLGLLQDKIVIKYDESRRRMDEKTKQSNDIILNDSVNTNNAIVADTVKTNQGLIEAQKKHQEEVVKTESELKDNINKINLDKYDYAYAKLEEEYDIKAKSVEDKKLLDEWYQAEWKKIRDEEEGVLAEEAEKRLKKQAEDNKKILDAEAQLRDDLAKIELDKYDYRYMKLEEEYDLKAQNVKDKKLLDEWYQAQWKVIQDEEEKELADNYEKQKGYTKTHADARFKTLREGSAKWLDALTIDVGSEESIVKQTSKSIRQTLVSDANERVKVLLQAAAKMITGHVAEGLTMVGASSFGLADALLAVGSYGAKIAASIATAKAIGNAVLAEGGRGWIDTFGSGVIREGTTSRADDVFLKSEKNTNFWGSKGEYVINAESTAAWLPEIEWINKHKKKFAEGGYIYQSIDGKIDKKYTDGGILSTIQESVQTDTSVLSNVISLIKNTFTSLVTSLESIITRKDESIIEISRIVDTQTKEQEKLLSAYENIQSEFINTQNDYEATKDILTQTRTDYESLQKEMQARAQSEKITDAHAVYNEIRKEIREEGGRQPSAEAWAMLSGKLVTEEIATSLSNLTEQELYQRQIKEQEAYEKSAGTTYSRVIEPAKIIEPEKIIWEVPQEKKLSPYELAKQYAAQRITRGTSQAKVVRKGGGKCYEDDEYKNKKYQEGGALYDPAMDLVANTIGSILNLIVSSQNWMTDKGTNWNDFLNQEDLIKEDRNRFLDSILKEIGIYDYLKEELGGIHESSIDVLPDFLEYTLKAIENNVIHAAAAYPEKIREMKSREGKGSNDIVDKEIGGPKYKEKGETKDRTIERMAWNLGLGTAKSAVMGWITGGDWLQGLGKGAAEAGGYLITAIPEMFAANIFAPMISKAAGLKEGGPVSFSEKLRDKIDKKIPEDRRSKKITDENLTEIINSIAKYDDIVDIENIKFGLGGFLKRITKIPIKGGGTLGDIARGDFKKAAGDIWKGVKGASLQGIISDIVKNAMKSGTLGDLLKGDFAGAAEDINKGMTNFFKDPGGTMTSIYRDVRDTILNFDFLNIFKWILDTVANATKGAFKPVAKAMYEGSEALDLSGIGGKFNNLITSKNFLKLFSEASELITVGTMPYTFTKGVETIFDNGGVITRDGLEPFDNDHVRFSGVGKVGEVMIPPEKLGNTINVNLNFELNGIDRNSARSAVRDYIIPELNYYLTSKGAKAL